MAEESRPVQRPQGWRESGLETPCSWALRGAWGAARDAAGEVGGGQTAPGLEHWMGSVGVMLGASERLFKRERHD